MDTLTPRYLYKILSSRHWQTTQNRETVTVPAEDEAFIHLATENQLDKIINKYWSEASQYTILKLETERLIGELVCEANPGGETKYYHLYRGMIPFNAIVESKMVYRQAIHPPSTPSRNLPSTNAFSHPHPLEIVKMGDPVLRQPARELTKKEILSPEIQKLIQEMKLTMRAAPGIGLAAPQIGQPLQLAVIEDFDHSHLTKEQLLEKERFPVPFHVIINPKIFLEKGEEVSFFEGCLSIPGFVAIVPRARSLRMECLNERGEEVVINAKGWYARIIQHEVDHLNAVLYLDRSFLPTLMTEDNYVKTWKGKKIQEVINTLTNEKINQRYR